LFFPLVPDTEPWQKLELGEFVADLISFFKKWRILAKPLQTREVYVDVFTRKNAQEAVHLLKNAHMLDAEAVICGPVRRMNETDIASLDVVLPRNPLNIMSAQALIA